MFITKSGTGFKAKMVLPHHPTDRWLNHTLIRYGYLSPSPHDPKVAFSLETLELYHQLRRHNSNLGVQGFIRTLCGLYNVRFFSLLVTGLRD